MPSYGQFGTPGYFGKDIPPDIIKQYPGTQNIMQAGQMFGNLLYGPYSKDYQVAAAQASDPTAQAFQTETGTGGGAFSAPGAGAAALSQLFSGDMAGNVAGQHAQQQQQQKAAQGMYDVANTYAQDIYGTQSAANTLARAKAEQQQQEEQGVMSLVNMFTNPQGPLSNILGPGGLNISQGGQSPLGLLWSGTGGPGSGGGLGGLLGFGGAAAGGLGGVGGAGLDITDFSSMLSSLGLAGGAAEGGAEGLDALALLGAA